MHWFPAPLLPLVPRAGQKRWFPASSLSPQPRCSTAHWLGVPLHSCSPSPCTAEFLSRCRRVSPSCPWGHFYLDLTASSWSIILRGWQTRLPWSGLVISQVPKPFHPAGSSTPMLLPQECCERRSFLPACAPTSLQRGNRALALSVLRFAMWCLFKLVRPTQAVGCPSR
jgi:hypothetical protein